VWRGRIVLLAGDERSTGERIGEWSAALAGAPTWGMADLQGLPFFVPRAAVRKSLREVAPKTAVLLDWSGAAYAALGLPKGAIAVHVYDATGALRLRVLGPPASASVQQVKQALSG
jgi:predicted transcriptional regulator